MNKKLLAVWGLVCLAVALSGCVRTLDDKRKAAMPFMKDQFVSRYEKPMNEVWTAAKRTLEANGKLTSEDPLNYYLVAEVNERTVWIRVQEFRPTVVEVTVQVRQGAMPDLSLASEIDKQIALRLK